ncbi:M20/M25/M40 family metallo-hydrolase [Bacillus dakarensis]|uniref:M20/M25/M40 family metallo-hydrolase n=1 Tax=Robertmurraya dakarensis TaxID=1926278 RepID=UPI003B013518
MECTVNVFNVFPSKWSSSNGEVKFTFGFRHSDDDVINKAVADIEKQLREIAERRSVELDFHQTWGVKGSVFSNEVIEHIEQAVKAYDYSYQYITSTSQHDASHISKIVKPGMIFAPSAQGLSHCEDEFTSYEDIEKTSNVLLQVIKSLANN